MNFRPSHFSFLAGALGVSAAFAVISANGVAQEQAANPNIAYNSRGKPYVKGEFLVKVRSQAALERFVDGNRAAIGTFSERKALTASESGKWYKVKVDNETHMATAMQRALGSDGVVAMEPNYIYTIDLGPGRPKPTPTPTATPNPGAGGPDYQTAPALPDPAQADPQMGQLYGLSKIDAAGAWATTVGSKKVIVADIDTGADYNHPDLINNMWKNPGEIPGNGIDDDHNGYVDDVLGYDFRDKDARPYDDNMHGSHTAGTIGATGGNGVGVSGVSQKVSLMVLRFLGGSEGSGTTEDAISAIEYATANGADIMSNSWGGGEKSQAMEDAVRAADRKGILFVAAAGNSYSDNDAEPTYPANYNLSNVLVVAATDSSDRKASFSNYGLRTVHLAAPGVAILSTVPNNRYSRLDGTSMACPHVSGAAALLKAAWPQLKAAQLKELLLESVDAVAAMQGKTITGGRMNVARAFALAREKYGNPVGE